MSTGAVRAGLRALLVGVAVIAGTAACDRTNVDASRVPLDGSPRRPDAAGVVAAVSRTELRLVGGDTFRLDRNLQSFASQTMETVSVLQRKGQYVHVGADGDRAVWVAAVGSVIEVPRPTVYYPGRVRSVRGREVHFADGTVLRLARGVEAPDAGTHVVAEIDVGTDEVRAIPPA